MGLEAELAGEAYRLGAGHLVFGARGASSQQTCINVRGPGRDARPEARAEVRHVCNAVRCWACGAVLGDAASLDNSVLLCSAASVRVRWEVKTKVRVLGVYTPAVCGMCAGVRCGVR